MLAFGGMILLFIFSCFHFYLAASCRRVLLGAEKKRPPAYYRPPSLSPSVSCPFFRQPFRRLKVSGCVAFSQSCRLVFW